ncbi:undecaprenyl/decaprenyl-phosphate alpha-N-acetylglucosaminyl 1-phosphate transferase [Streptomyces sp. ISL-12]|uniref:undecaprenyl/decaprenyl-phosphate alpha-N-acetylglucosaminyl 1-phosphate transferase n=1 Tax=Streptomyces sp. ISL-12 TaxID=2819177 RepID=UPI001BEBB41B|nr:undecaprenyl/decaprenyl-phosphate alpha-N-acetylglucosaminyl 1-phosphate transferase [Streptomyces sp. ISL-12]MBT2412308.1 undecaprenyl/decaprenyl-phosphate alpha-N-acetylglucosaminyl 1-phosphate transferase [Streptomyces sp. ISL-12]
MLYGIVSVTLLAALLAPLLRPLALRAGVVGRRPAARRPVPLSGGIAAVAGAGLAAWAGERAGVVPLGTPLAALLAGGAGVGLLGLAADVWRLRRRWQAAGTAVAAAWVVPYEETGVVAGAAAVVWIVLVTLAFRGLDHADGLAGTVGVVTALGLGVCAAAELMDGLAVLLCVLAAALAGVLSYDWPPARSGLGACGSLSAGFTLASAAVLVRAGHAAGDGAVVLGALTAVVGADAVLVLMARRPAGRPARRSAPDHLAHRLRRLGLTARGAVLLPAAGAFGSVLVGVLVHLGRLHETAVLWVAGVGIVGVLSLARAGVHEVRRARSYGVRRVSPPYGARRVPPSCGAERTPPSCRTERAAPLRKTRKLSPPYGARRLSPYGTRKVSRPYETQKVSRPYETQKMPQPYGTRKVSQPYETQKAPRPYETRKLPSPFRARRLSSYGTGKVSAPREKRPAPPYGPRQAPPLDAPQASRAPWRVGNFPVRQTRRTASVQVSDLLRVRNG